MTRRRTLGGRRIRQRLHAMRRAEERYGIAMNLTLYVHLCDRMWSYLRGVGDTGVYHVDGFKTPMFFVWYQRVPLLVRWDDDTAQITTFLVRANAIADRERVIAIRDTPRHKRWKFNRDLVQVSM